MYKAIAFDISKRTLICLSFLFYFLAYAENVSEPLSRYYGEKLVYHISWLGISAGEAVLKTNVVLYHGKRVLRFMGSVRSALWFEKIYYVEDTVYTYVDPVTLAPFEIAVDFREGKDFRKKNNYIFDSKNKTVTVGNSGKPALHVPEDVMDMFGAFFTARIHPYRKGESLRRYVADGRKCYEVKSFFNGYTELDSVLGLKRCIEIRPTQVKLDLIGISQNPSALSIYLTDDRMRIPLLVTGEIRIGSLVAKLIKAEFPLKK